MIHSEEQKIIEVFRQKPFTWFTLKELMRLTNKRSYNWAYQAMTRLVEEKILVTEKIGNIYRYAIAHNSPQACSALIQSEQILASKRFPNGLYMKLIINLAQYTPFFSLLVGGSYASGTQRKDSDIDLVVIVEDDRQKKAIRPYLIRAQELEPYKFDNQIFTKEELKEMLTNHEHNFGTELARKHLILYGADIFHSILREAHADGFQD